MTPPTETGGPAPLNLGAIGESTAEQAAAWAAELLADSAAGAEGLARDRELLRVLRGAETLDDILRGIPLSAVHQFAERCANRLQAAAEPLPLEARRAAWDCLDLLRRPPLLQRLAEQDCAAWAERILRLVDSSELTVGPLLQTRVATYGSRPLLQQHTAAGQRSWSWRQVAARAETLARGLLALADGDESPVALLSENRVEVVWLDLACLSVGLVNVPIPANATESDVRFILEHCGAQIVIASDREQLNKVLKHRDALPNLRHIFSMDPPPRGIAGVLELDEVAARSALVSPEKFERRSLAVRTADRATIMYTSGTTGTPKAIQFSQRNLVYKRFARALALPEIGDRDTFLCYLPLYHTFGRFLEMLGCVFWGATYCLLADSSRSALIQAMRRHRPTVFISVPRKWIQLYETIAHEADPQQASDEELLDATRRVTGGRLRWGLSAAGHLDSEIFRFFQRQGVELMSGFGMTEGTGGITMTPPGKYKDDSLGVALPGVECRLAEDGELLVRGPYMMMGYLNPPDGGTSFDQDGWFHTGDLMEVDGDGHYRLVDRKKEIYKNIKGETIAPQRVENLFRELEAVGRVFLVGDHRAYNTALIFPNPACRQPDFSRLDPDETRDHFRSLVVSVNKFLAPYERIVDFAIVDRDLDAERGELTPKGTPRRKVVERNFAAEIRRLYRRTNIRTGNVELVLANWLFQALGVTAQEIGVLEHGLKLRTTGATLEVRRIDSDTAQVGSCVYRHPPGPINLGALLNTPHLWAGNEALVRFLDLDPSSRRRPRAAAGCRWLARVTPPAFEDDTALATALNEAQHDLMHLHLAALALLATEVQVAGKAVRLLESILREDEGILAEPARRILARAVTHPDKDIQRRAFLALVQTERESRFGSTLGEFLAAPGVLLDPSTRETLTERDLPDTRLDAFRDALNQLDAEPRWTTEHEARAESLLCFLAEFGAAHPTRFRRLRAFLVRTMLGAAHRRVRSAAARAVQDLQAGFRQWLAPTQRIAVDPETGHEYRWADVVAFDKDVPDHDRERLLSAIRDTGFLREAVFLFSRGATVRLSDIPPGGIWIRPLGSRHGKAVYRITVQTRYQGAYEVAANVNHGNDPQQVREELQWLVLCGESGDRDPLVEDFGGFWPEQDLWSEEFIPGETLDRVLRRSSRRESESEHFRQTWPFYAWSALTAYIDFWNRTGRRQEIAEPSTRSVIVPTHDYLTGGRLVSVSQRRTFTGLGPMILRLRDGLLKSTAKERPELAGVADDDLIFSALLEVVGEQEGVEMLRVLQHEDGSTLPEDLRVTLERHLARIDSHGFVPMRLFLAAQRYRRWAALSVEPTVQARARILRELFEDYGLRRLGERYPETRVRFFRESVFHDAPEVLAQGLDEIIHRLRSGDLVGDAVVDAIADLRSRMNLGPDEDYFLARLSYPHLRPEDDAGFVETRLGGRHQSEVMVTLDDRDDNPFLVRHALNPKEVDRLHRLFLQANLDVRFRQEHQYLVALNERLQIIGGIYYEIEEEGGAHLEKIVVSERHQKKGVASGLMHEFFNRLRAAGIRTVTTGFYRPEYFYGFGFAIEKRYAGLVKNLVEGDAEAA